MATKKASLAELMGSEAAGSGGQLKLSQLGSILGDAMPELPRNPLGRHRLVRALQQRFGPNFRSLPGIKGLIQQFDGDIAHEDTKRRIAAIKLGGPRGR